MALFGRFLLFVLSLALLISHLCTANQEKKVYIVYMGALPMDVGSSHIDLLSSVIENGTPNECLIHSFKRSFNGFVAKLTESEKIKLSEDKSVVSVIPDQLYSTHTTRSWDFLGLNLNITRNLQLEKDVIVGIIDTGIWPESQSFNDEGLGPPPKKWKGTCHSGFPCNNKIIGARFYNSSEVGEIESARDIVGHGTHTASTVAGALVHNVSLNGLAEGTAKGGVPSARLAIYSVCTSFGCGTSSILAAFDDAIADGVDMISISIGGRYLSKYFDDAIAIGSFHAMANGILTSTSAGNNGPSAASLSNAAPWLMSVAASSIDRKFTTKVVLGNDELTVEGISINPFDTEKLSRPLIKRCDSMGNDVVDKIIFCQEEPGYSDSYGEIFPDNSLDYARSYYKPTSALKDEGGGKIMEYMKHSRKATAKIYKSEEPKDPNAPIVVSFSSRGPNNNTLDIIKPDISAPGVNILAAWSPKGEVTTDFEKGYTIQSGTSMACPHATAAAAYVKSFHPTWSPAALRSALMTTATPMSPIKNNGTEFAYGSGQINPREAVNPGLVYETGVDDYIRMLCSEGLTEQQIRLITGDSKSSCPGKGSPAGVRDLNYPSIAYHVNSSSPFNVSFARRLTNVGLTGSNYKVQITSDRHTSIVVEPSTLNFKEHNEELEFTVKVSGNGIVAMKDLEVYSSAIVWSDGPHSVRSPVIVYYYRV